MKIFRILIFIMGLTLWSCEGDQGPAGPPGADGLISQVFEAQIDFTSANDFQAVVDIPTSIEVYPTDVVMVYVLAAIDGDIDIWEPLPQTLYFDEGILMYGYDYTFQDVRFFIDGTVDPSLLLPEYTDGLIFRVAVIPADMALSLDVSNFNEVMKAAQNQEIEKLIP